LVGRRGKRGISFFIDSFNRFDSKAGCTRDLKNEVALIIKFCPEARRLRVR